MINRMCDTHESIECDNEYGLCLSHSTRGVVLAPNQIHMNTVMVGCGVRGARTPLHWRNANHLIDRDH